MDPSREAFFFFSVEISLLVFGLPSLILSLSLPVVVVVVAALFSSTYTSARARSSESDFGRRRERRARQRRSLFPGEEKAPRLSTQTEEEAREERDGADCAEILRWQKSACGLRNLF